MSIDYLENYLESLEPLPSELQRNFTLLKDLDGRVFDMEKKVSHMLDEYGSKASTLNATEKMEFFTKIHQMMERCKNYSDDKVQLAMQTYELVDKHIRKLDSELSNLDTDLKSSKLHDSMVSTGSGGAENVDKKKGGRKEKKVPVISTPDIENDKKKLNIGGVAGKVTGKATQAMSNITSAVIGGLDLNGLLTVATEVGIDMPVDPNEPTYCTCHQVSYGEMIGCDNSECQIEWFHFACVGLTQKPKGKWFCHKCSLERKKK